MSAMPRGYSAPASRRESLEQTGVQFDSASKLGALRVVEVKDESHATSIFECYRCYACYSNDL